MSIIEINNLSKTYQDGKTAVNDISLSINAGEIFGFLGPNGAGKTTTIKLLTGLLQATAGTCLVNGYDPCLQPEKVHEVIGVVTEHSQMYNHLTGLQNLIFYGTLFGMTETAAKEHSLALLAKLDLLVAKDQKLATYSTGMRQRLSLARAMIHHPKMLFLDEPTSGLDPESILHVNNMIRELAEQQGVSVFLCTHQLRYAQELCTSYGLIDAGTMFAHGDFATLQAEVTKEITVDVEADLMPSTIAATKVADNRYQIKVKTETDIPLLIKEIITKGGKLYAITPRELTLEDIYFDLLNLYRKQRSEKHD